MIKQGNKVKVHYTGRLTDGEVFDSSEGREPIEFEVGTSQVIKGFEDAVLGLNVGDKATVTIQPENGYGMVREDLIISVEKDQVPENVEVGVQLQGLGQNGQPFNVTVKEINDDSVKLDANHPLAGKVMEFEINVVEVN
jgi:peptidylprolyl isomerase